MPGPHEFATLRLVRQVPGQVELGRAELGALLARQFIALENLASGRSYPRVTSDGDSILNSISRIREADAVSAAWLWRKRRCCFLSDPTRVLLRRTTDEPTKRT